jgi:ABC-2 type transport system permease protein/lipopolysaccharide transport system permease protein
LLDNFFGIWIYIIYEINDSLFLMMLGLDQMVNIVKSITDEIKETYRFRWVVYSFISSTLKMRYRRSILGFAWSLIGPMLNYLVMGLVISKVGRFTSKDFLAHMLIGSCIFNYMNVGFTLGGNSLIGNEHYIRKIYLPKLVFPLSSIGMEAVNFLLSLIALIVILLSIGKLELNWYFLFVPLSLITITFFTLGMGIMLSVLIVFFRDLNHIVPIVMQIAFFSTPIIYPESAIPTEYLPWLKFNPFYYLIELVRTPFIKGELPSIESLCLAFSISIIAFIVGLLIIKKYDNKIIFKL